jgi:hypothetical protein
VVPVSRLGIIAPNSLWTAVNASDILLTLEIHLARVLIFPSHCGTNSGLSFRSNWGSLMGLEVIDGLG